MERVEQECLNILVDKSADGAIARSGSAVAAGAALRELCHDLIEPTATIRCLVRAADAESGPDLRNRLGTIAIVAGQIAAICEQILGQPQPCPSVRLDLLADAAAASARVRYDGVIDVTSQPVVALAGVGDIDRILFNVLTNACRHAGPLGRVRVLVDEVDGYARLAVADSGRGFGHGRPGGRVGLGLEIIGALALHYGGGVRLGVADLGGLAVTVWLPAPGRSSN
jgi:signal transduction histidine kinase